MTKKIIDAKPYKNSISAPIIKIGVLAISISVLVMMVSVAVGLGMQKEIKDKISSIEGHINISSFRNISNENSINPIVPDQEFLNWLDNIPEISRVEKIITKFGIFRTPNEFEGGYFKGISAEYNFSEIERFIIEGELILKADEVTNNVVVSQILSDKLRLNVGDNFQMLSSKNQDDMPSVTGFKISGIYNSGFEELDSKYIFGDYRHIQRINKWDKNEISSIEIHLNNHSDLDLVSDMVYLNSPSDYDVVSSKEKYYSIFEWIKLFDKNIVAILFIMTLVASINIISVLLVLILERINMIGILKALGAKNSSIRKYFIYTSMYLIFRGVLIGNFIGGFLIFIQQKFKIISLDSKIYYVDTVPIFFKFSHFLYLNLLILFVCFCAIIIPSFLVSKINPKDTIKFN